MKFIKCEERICDTIINPLHLVKATLSPGGEEYNNEWLVIGEMTQGEEVILFMGTLYESEEYLNHLCQMTF